MKKKNIIYGLLLLGISCTSEKQLSVQLPCMPEALDNEANYCALGIGESVNLQAARQQSFINAQHELMSRFASGIYSSDHIQTTIQSAKFAIPALQNVCSKVTIDKQKVFHAFTAVSIPKREVSEREIIFIMSNGDSVSNPMKCINLPEHQHITQPKGKNKTKTKKNPKKQNQDETLEIETNRDKFRSYFEDRSYQMNK
ncbi:MAG: hypothetical protein NC396_07635 [Bacteroides sp.]|nr:hypothetical protein [Bacteroides sp.]MCM1086174.1 hypothetical protein [Bacteroides sp.]